MRVVLYLHAAAVLTGSLCSHTLILTYKYRSQ